MPTNFIFLKWCPSEKFFNSWLCHLSCQASSLSFSITFHLYVYLHHCNPFPALDSFCCQYLKQFLFLCLDADWLTDWGRNQPHFNEEETEGQGGSANLTSLKDRGGWSLVLNWGLISPEACAPSLTLACVLFIGATWTKSNFSYIIPSYCRRKLSPSSLSLQLLLLRTNCEFPLMSWLSLLD